MGRVFRLRRRMVRKGDGVRASGNDAPFLDNHGRKRPATARADIFQRQRDGALHEVWGHDLPFYWVSDCTVRPKIATRYYSDAWNRLTTGQSARRAPSPPGLQENEMAVGCNLVRYGWWQGQGARFTSTIFPNQTH